MSAKTHDSKNTRFSVKSMVVTAMFAALIAVCSILSIPVGEVPVTLQTFAVCLSAAMLGWKRGTLSVFVYILLGAVGVPVFAGMSGGIGILAGPTGGFLIGFIIAALVFWLLEKLIFGKLMNSTVKTWIFGALNSLVFEIVLYTVGVIWFMTVYAAQTGAVGLGTVMTMCVIPFIIPDAVKLIAAVVIGERAGKLVKN